jgi:lipopolysaccharide/colanic/teichoic acid biosynthesis glycosyltransferase
MNTSSVRSHVLADGSKCESKVLIVSARALAGSVGIFGILAERVGRDAGRFKILKFRTMVDGAEAIKMDLLACP